MQPPAHGEVALDESRPANPDQERAALRRSDESWLGAIVRIRRDGYREFLRCAGALIAPRWLLTVAHCPADMPETTRVVFGRRDLGAECGVVRRVAAIRKHKGFDYRTKLNDIALLKLATPVPAAALQYRDVPSGLEAPGAAARAWGWGHQPSTGDDDAILKSCRLELLAGDDGVAAGWFSRESSPFMFATRDRSEGPPLGRGDSGGPVVADAEGARYAIGIVSHIAVPDRSNPVIIHTRVSAYQGWIDGTIAQHGDLDPAGP